MKKARSKRRQFRRRPINVLASAMTTFNLYCGIASIFYSVSALLGSTLERLYVQLDFTQRPALLDSPEDMLKFAATLIFFGLIFDMLDGTVAKLTHSTSEFGKQLDSLCDLVTFGVAPGVLVYTAFLQDAIADNHVTAPVGSVAAVIFVICGALRLARFNTYQADRREYFTGLPIPAAGITIASFILFQQYFVMEKVALWILGPMTLILAYLMVSTLRYPKDKMKSMVLAPGNALQLLALFVLGIGVFDFASSRSPAIVLFPAAVTYVLFGIGDYFYAVVRRRPLHEPEPAPEQGPPVG
jgi:CDP-diacylglycerol--serine O-phosphatidyltransferase